MVHKLGIPYMGGKRVLSKQWVEYMLQQNPKAKYVYDLFGGGGAISFEFLQRKQIKEVYYNELNTGVVELLKKIQTDGVTDEFYNWISREEFNDLKTLDTWKAGLAKTCWSFGSSQKTYLYNQNIEENKRLLHEIIVNKCVKSRNEFYNTSGVLVDDTYLQINALHERRLKITRLTKNRVENLERIQHLENMKQLENLKNNIKFNITNLSYDEVNITTPIDETIIYLDPPYNGKKKYQF